MAHRIEGQHLVFGNIGKGVSEALADLDGPLELAHGARLLRRGRNHVQVRLQTLPGPALSLPALHGRGDLPDRDVVVPHGSRGVMQVRDEGQPGAVAEVEGPDLD